MAKLARGQRLLIDPSSTGPAIGHQTIRNNAGYIFAVVAAQGDSRCQMEIAPQRARQWDAAASMGPVAEERFYRGVGIGGRDSRRCRNVALVAWNVVRFVNHCDGSFAFRNLAVDYRRAFFRANDHSDPSHRKNSSGFGPVVGNVSSATRWSKR